LAEVTVDEAAHFRSKYKSEVLAQSVMTHNNSSIKTAKFFLTCTPSQWVILLASNVKITGHALCEFNKQISRVGKSENKDHINLSCNNTSQSMWNSH
jgi:hypothetical protein